MSLPRPPVPASLLVANLRERDEHVANFHRLPSRDVNLFHSPPERGRYLDLSFVGLDLQQRGVLANDLALADQNLDDLGLGEPFAEIGQPKRAGHREPL